ncbi:MAG: kynureninase [Bacillota bacterium]
MSAGPTLDDDLPLDDDLLEARRRDASDPLAAFRRRFYTRDGVLYMDGNSLGLLSRDAEAAVQSALAAWRDQAVEGWTGAPEPWFTMAERVAARQAALVGAAPDEVAVTGSTTANLHHLLLALYRPRGRRTRLVGDVLNFPSDLYALEAQVRRAGLDPSRDLILVGDRDGLLDEDDLIAAMDERAAVAVFSSVLYRSGQLLDMARLAAAARERGVLIGFDLSHSVGVVPHRLSDWGVDFAVWCNYKYVNGGPGTVAGLYLNRRHHGLVPPLTGWWGSDKRRQFEMLSTFVPAEGAAAWQVSTPPILSLAPLEAAVGILEEAGIERIRAKSLALTEFLLDLVDRHLAGFGFRVGTPREPHRRGGHVALRHPDGARIAAALRLYGVVPDFRPPDVIRLAPSPLYTRFEDVWLVVRRLRAMMEQRLHLQAAVPEGTVT